MKNLATEAISEIADNLEWKLLALEDVSVFIGKPTFA
jgi:hypothetical protein